MEFNIQRFVAELNNSFGHPFLPKGFFRASRRGNGFKLIIGDRDVEFDANGKLRSSGTRVSEGRKWDIKNI